MAKLFADSEDPDQTPCSAASDLGLHCLQSTLLWVPWLQWVKTGLAVYSTLSNESVSRRSCLVGLDGCAALSGPLVAFVIKTLSSCHVSYFNISSSNCRFKQNWRKWVFFSLSL